MISLGEAMKAHSALRAAAGLEPEMFPVEAFVGMISDEVEVRESSGIEKGVKKLAENSM